jgi:F-type H+-transporting ATPase subunit b
MRAVIAALVLSSALASAAAAQPPEQPRQPEQAPFPGLRQEFHDQYGEVPPGEPFEPIDELVPFEPGQPVDPSELPQVEEQALPAHERRQDELYHDAHGAGEEAGEELHLREAPVEHGAHGHVGCGDVASSTEFWGSVVNFTLLMVILVLMGRKPLGTFLVSRRRAIEEGLAEATRLREAAKKKYDEYHSRLEKLDREIAAIRKEMVAAGEAERDRIVSEAEAKAARMRREAEFLIEQQVKQLRVDLTREAAFAAVNAAGKVLRESMSAEDQQRLAHEYLEQLNELPKEEARS